MLNFQDLYQTYAADVYRFAYWLTGDGDEAEDVTSETFVRAWTKRTTIRTETLKAYLFSIARNTFLEQCRKRKRLVVLEDDLPDPAPGPVDQVENRLHVLRVKNALLVYPEIDRTAFILRVQHGLPYAEISRVLRISLVSARVKVHRIRKKLLADLLDEEIPHE